MANARTVAVKQDPTQEVPTEILAREIVAISEGIKQLRSGRMNDRALILLIQHVASVALTQKQIKAVLDGMECLRAAYLRG